MTLLTQKGPETPYRYATPDDCSSVAAQVQEDTTADATRPDLTVLPAVLNISEVWDSLLYLRCTTRSSEQFALRGDEKSRHCVSPLQNPGGEDHSKGKQEAEADDDAVAISLAERRGYDTRRWTTATGHDDNRLIL